MKPRTVIIGGGVIGASSAYYLAKEGLNPLLIEQKTIASGASGAGGGALLLQTKGKKPKLDLALKGCHLFQDLGSELNEDLEYCQEGSFIVARDDSEMEHISHLAKKEVAAGLDAHLLNQRETIELQPHLTRDILGSLYLDSDARVNNIKLTFALAKAARRLGAEIRTFAPVRRIEQSREGIFAIFTDQGKIETEIVVNAAGAWASKIAAMAGITVPISPRRGQLLVTEILPPLIRGHIVSGRYLIAKEKKSEGGIGFSQTASGNLVMGTTREFVGFRNRTTYSAISEISRDITALVPFLRQTHIIRSFAGLRPYTPDGLPILGRVGSTDNFIMASGHEGDGISLSLITGKIVADLVMRRKPCLDLAPFSPDRFERKEFSVGSN